MGAESPGQGGASRLAVGGLLPMPAWVLRGDSVGVGAGGHRGEALDWRGLGGL